MNDPLDTREEEYQMALDDEVQAVLADPDELAECYTDLAMFDLEPEEMGRTLHECMKELARLRDMLGAVWLTRVESRVRDMLEARARDRAEVNLEKLARIQQEARLP